MGEITRFSCTFNRLFMVLIPGFSWEKSQGEKHLKSHENPQKNSQLRAHEISILK